MSKVDVLNLEWTSCSSRDREVATLICNHLRNRGLCVHEGSIFDGFTLINNLKPRLLFITNSIGAVINHYTFKYAKSKGIKCISLISEGNFIDSDSNYIDQFIWGWNKDKILIEDHTLYWSKKFQSLHLKKFPENKNRVHVSGAVAFDIYKLSDAQELRNSTLSALNKSNFNKVIGIAGWNFELFKEDYHNFETVYKKLYPSKDIQTFRTDHSKIINILVDLVKNNPDILFIFKKHPGAKDFYNSGIDSNLKADNLVLISNEIPLIDCIQSSDLWLIYDSTTALESWLLNVETILLNPTTTEFVRDDLYKGSFHVSSLDEAQEQIDHFFRYRKLLAPDMLKVREKLIQDITEYSDGLNHLRAANFIYSFLMGDFPSFDYKTTLKDQLFFLKQKLKYFLRKKHRFSDIEVSELANARKILQDNFYIKNSLKVNEIEIYSKSKT